MPLVQKVASHTWMMIAEMGPYLIMGFAISVLLYRYLKQAWVERLMGRRHFSSIIWGSLVGVPMPLCSCGVIPVTMSLRSKGASKGASVSFLTSTPQTGVDSFLATYALLGPVFAIYKIIVAFISGILVGAAVELLGGRSHPNASSSATSCEKSKEQTQPSWNGSLRYGFLTMPGDLAGALLVGFALAGAISALAPADLLTNLPGGAITAVLLATAISVPLYICSTGSIPLALALIHSGLPVSAALVLLIAGPAITVTTITAMHKVLGTRSTAIYVTGVVLNTWLAAAVFHFFFASHSFAHADMHHHMETLPLWKHLGGAALITLLVVAYLLSKRGLRPAKEEILTATPDMKTATLKIEGMSCSHCENSVTQGLADLPFISKVVAVNRNTGSAIVQGPSIEEEPIRAKLAALGFDYKGCEPTV